MRENRKLQFLEARRMGGKQSAPEPIAPDHTVWVLVVGCCSLGITEPLKLINKFVSGEYEFARIHEKSKPAPNWPPERLASVDDELYSLRFVNVRSSSAFSFNHESVYKGLLRCVQELSPMVGIMIVYNPVIYYSFEVAQKIVDHSIPKIFREAPSLRHVPVMLVSDRCRERGMRRARYSVVNEFVGERDIPVVEVRGEEGTNVELAFMTLVGKVLVQRKG